MSSRIINKIPFFIFAVYIASRLFLLNNNVAEWGDSYRILDASQSIIMGQYPKEEKRPPLFSLFLAACPQNHITLTCHRSLLLGVDVFFFWGFWCLLNQLVPNRPRTQQLALLIFCFNPVLWYWSLRIMSDVLFATLVLWAMVFFYRWKAAPANSHIFLMSLMTILAIMTRFEGYILAISLGVGLASHLKLQNTRPFLTFLLFCGVLYLPLFLWRNPLTSSYFNEPARRAYNLETLWVFVSSTFYIFGFTWAFSLLFSAINKLKGVILEHAGVFTFVAIELILILLWPAAIPRIFTPIIALLTIPLAHEIDEYLDGRKEFKTLLIVSLLLTVFFLVSQYFLRIQFLVVNKFAFLAVVTVSVLSLLTIALNKRQTSVALAILSVFIWSVSIIWSHKDIYKSLLAATFWAKNNISETIGYSAINGISGWYLADRGKVVPIVKNDGILDINRKRTRYIITSEELYKDGDLNLQELTNYEILKSFTYEINGKIFTSSVVYLQP